MSSVVAPDMSDDTQTAAPDVAPTAVRIDLYWRPGCGYCSMLQRGLDGLGIERQEHNIWESPTDAATVRGHANGNETVPTVVVGDQAFVNPSARELVAYLAEHHPHLLPDSAPNGSGVLSGP